MKSIERVGSGSGAVSNKDVVPMLDLNVDVDARCPHTGAHEAAQAAAKAAVEAAEREADAGGATLE